MDEARAGMDLWVTIPGGPKVAFGPIPTPWLEPLSFPPLRPFPRFGVHTLLHGKYHANGNQSWCCAVLPRQLSVTHTVCSIKADDHGLLVAWSQLQTWHHWGITIQHWWSGLIGLTGCAEDCPIQGPVDRILLLG